jgi:protease IV
MTSRSWLAFALVVMTYATFASPMANAADKAAKKPIVPVFRLTGAISEKPPVADILFGSAGGESLEKLVGRLKKAGDDEDVKAIVLLVEGASIGRAQTEELRQAMGKLREKGKEIYVHSDSLSMGDYVLLSGASRISVVPTADVWVTGMGGEAMYLRGLLDKLGVQPDFLTCGAYKSAAETYMRSGPSSAAEEMQNWLLDSLFESSIEQIAAGRKVETDKARQWIDNGPYVAEKAVAAGLIDAVEHRQDFTAVIKAKYGDNVVFERKYGHKKAPELDLSSPFGILKLWTEAMNEAKAKKSTKDSIAIVYVEGAIDLGNGEISPFSMSEGASSSTIRKALDEAAKDDSVKAVVLRVNSPGGSATASEIILDATKRVKARKPFVVSMGDVAGSGGYYVACGSDTIFADASTITGSIGVVGGKLATTGLWEKVGVSFKEYRRGANAGMLSSAHVFSEPERVRMQAWMDEIYGVFKGHVVAARGDRLKKPIDELAGGRVYTGKQALELGLVDKLGTLDDAIQYIATEAKLETGKYDVRVIPKNRDFFEQLFEQASGEEGDTDRVGLAEALAASQQRLSLVELAMPSLKHLDPQRAAAVIDSLRQLELLHRDGVSLLTPPLMTGR